MAWSVLYLRDFPFSISYHFLEDAYEYHKERVQTMAQQLQDKKKLIEEVSNTIDNRFVFTQSREHFVCCIFLLHSYFIF